MTTDLRELLREARAYIVDVREGKDYHNQRIVDRIDAALAENILHGALNRAEARVKELLARGKTNPIERLQNICDALNEQKNESPYDEKSWELADESNRNLQKEVAHWKACHNTANKLLAEACKKLEAVEARAKELEASASWAGASWLAQFVIYKLGGTNDLPEWVRFSAKAWKALSDERDALQARLETIDWSWIRSVLSQGASIQQDYQAGKYSTYEHYSARLDEAARELVEKITDRNADSPAATAEGQRLGEGEVGPPR